MRDDKAGTVDVASLTRMDRWTGKIALVTGASVGIGAKVAEELARRGLKVVAVARRLNKLEELKGRVKKEGLPGTIYPLECDVSKEEDILKVFKWIQNQFGQLDVLVNNAALLYMERIIEGSTENFRKIMDVNVLAVAICTREAVNLMSKNVEGHIININSVAGHNAELIKHPISLYACSKYAITAMCESVRNEIASKKLNIKITSISPGAVDTDMIRSLDSFVDLASKVPMLTSKDIADSVIYALSMPPKVEVREVLITPMHQAFE